MTGAIYPNRLIAGRQHEPISVGNYMLQLRPQHGYRIDPAPTLAPLHWARAIPIDLQAPPPPLIFGREREIHEATLALQAGRWVEVFGARGVGKTALLRYLAQQVTRSAFADGALYLSAHRQSADDLLQIIYHAFFESQSPYHPAALQVRQDMHYKRALIVLDDVDLSNDALLGLMSALDNCTFLIGSATRRLDPTRDSLSIPIDGLPPNEALALLEHGLGRTLRADEKGLANILCSVLGGNPLRILQAAALTHERGRTLASVVDDLTTRQPVDALHEQIIAKLSEVEREIVYALALFDRVPLHITHLHALVDASDVAGALNKLQQRGIVQSDGSSFRLNGGLNTLIRRRHDLTAHYTLALEHFTQWAAHRTHIHLPEAPALLELMTWAASTARWSELLALFDAIEDLLVMSQRWGAWESALQLALPAARTKRDRTIEARLLHQQGTRALCLGQASHPLIHALRLREMLHDKEGVEVTQHNLEMQLGRPKLRRPIASPSPWRRFATTIGPLAAVIGGIIILIWWPRTEQPVNISQVTQPAPTIVLPTATPIPTSPPTATATATNPPESDLLVKDFKVMPGVTVHADNSVAVPVQVDVKNVGQGLAGNVEVSFIVYNSPNPIPVNFSRYDNSTLDMPPDMSKAVGGTLTISGASAGKLVRILARVTSCSNINPLPADCPSIENNIANNLSFEILYTPPIVLYDFINNDNVKKASWQGSTSPSTDPITLNFPSAVNDKRGVVLGLDNFRIDNGDRIDYALVTEPADGRFGSIVGRYDLSDIQLREGDFFVAQVAFREGALQGNAKFILEFYDKSPDSSRVPLEEVQYKYGGGLHYWPVIIPSHLAGKSGYFYLTVNANGDNIDDWAVWQMARLMRQP